MTIDDKIKDEKLQYDINREAAKILALSPGKIDKYEYLTGEEILPPDQGIIIKQAKFTYFPLNKSFEKQIKTIKGIFPKDIRTNKIKNEIYEIKKWEENIKREDLKYKTKNYTYGFQQFKTIRSFDESIYAG